MPAKVFHLQVIVFSFTKGERHESWDHAMGCTHWCLSLLPTQPVFALCVRPRTLSNKNLELYLFLTYPAKKPLSTEAFFSPIKKNPW